MQIHPESGPSCVCVCGGGALFPAAVTWQTPPFSKSFGLGGEQSSWEQAVPGWAGGQASLLPSPRLPGVVSLAWKRAQPGQEVAEILR